MDVTRERAICMFYDEEFNYENVVRLLERIDNPGELDICYENDPLKPVLVLRTRILAEPHIYKRYKPSTSKSYSNKAVTTGRNST